MIRFICFLLGKPYEPCKSCETLKQQLAFANAEKKELTETLLNIIKPKTYEGPPIELNPTAQTGALFARRRAALEEKDRQEAKILKDKGGHYKVPDSIGRQTINDQSVDQLERELNVVEEGK